MPESTNDARLRTRARPIAYDTRPWAVAHDGGAAVPGFTMIWRACASTIESRTASSRSTTMTLMPHALSASASQLVPVTQAAASWLAKPSASTTSGRAGDRDELQRVPRHLLVLAALQPTLPGERLHERRPVGVDTINVDARTTDEHERRRRQHHA